jgi:PAS domain S-box-containing protein
VIPSAGAFLQTLLPAWSETEAAWVSAGAAVAVVLGGLIVTLWRGRNTLVRIVEFLVFPFTGLRKVNAQLAEILKELRPNGGLSIRDTVDRLEREQATFKGLLMATWDRDRKPVFQTDSIGRYIWVNRAFTTLTGRQRSEMAGWGWINAVHPGDRTAIRQRWIDAVTEKRNFEETFRLVDRESDVHAVQCIAYPAFAGETVTGWTGDIEVLHNRVASTQVGARDE